MARRADERGDATVETVLAVPVLLFLIMVVIQAGLWFHGAQIVEAAAQEGALAGRVETGSPAAAEERAREFVTRLSPSIASTAEVHASRSADVTRVVVSGRVQQLIPGLPLTVRGVAESPTERFREDR
ncbi:MAG: TadE family protein [Microthrixaceae bacterium]|jgi:Flp pilus assembly protein TadG